MISLTIPYSKQPTYLLTSYHCSKKSYIHIITIYIYIFLHISVMSFIVYLYMYKGVIYLFIYFYKMVKWGELDKIMFCLDYEFWGGEGGVFAVHMDIHMYEQVQVHNN